LAFDMHDTPDADGYSRPPFVANPASVTWGTQPPNNQGPNMDMLYDCPDPADAQLKKMPCSTYQRGGAMEYLSAAPRSQHAGGVNIAFVDGHVRFLNNQVDEYAMAYSVCANDGQAVDSTKF